MKRTFFLPIALSIVMIISCVQQEQQPGSETAQSETEQRDYFQLKIFRFESAEQEALLDNYFQDALLPALHRASI